MIKITVDTRCATDQEIRYFRDKFPMIDDMKREGRKWGIQYIENNSDKNGGEFSTLKEKSPSFIQVAVAFLFSFMVATTTLQSLWNWFIAPLGINELSSLHSAGLLLFTVLLQKDNLSSTFTKEELLMPTAKFITKCLLLFMLGLTIKSFM